MGRLMFNCCLPILAISIPLLNFIPFFQERTFFISHIGTFLRFVGLCQWTQNIREYYKTGKIFVNLGCYVPCLILVSSFILKKRNGWGRGVSVILARYTFHFIRVIWCKIQVIINPFL